MDYKQAVKLLEEGKGNKLVKDYFAKNNHQLEYGYSLLLESDLSSAYEVLSPLTSPRAEWASTIIPFLQETPKNYPSYFQLRNFLEIDIDLFFKYNQNDFVQTIIDYSDAFQDINSETYKFIARVLLKNNYYQASKQFLDKSLEAFYRDVELHYLYAEFYKVFDDKTNIRKAVETCLRLNPTYYPAIKTLEELSL